jgi:hypothetical protein
MTGEMSKGEVTRENFPLYFTAADEVPGATVEPFDKYQGPYINVPGKGRYFLTSDDGEEGNWWSESADEVSVSFFCGCSDDVPAEAFRDLVEHGGEKVNRE